MPAFRLGAVAGVAMGLVMEGDRYHVLTDIAGEEDHRRHGFQVAGTATASQHYKWM